MPPLANSIIRLNPGYRYTFYVRDEGWAGRIWPKIGCDQNGVNCEFGQSVPPCPPGGCQPPADTKVEFFFPPINSPDKIFFDITLVDGYSLAAEVIPQKDGQQVNNGNCIPTNCQVSLNQCPSNERYGLGDLRARNRYGYIVACLSPCKRWNYPPPWGLGRSEQQGYGKQFCCPSPVTPDECRRGAVVDTYYVGLVRNVCRNAYSYAYDDHAGLLNCPSGISFTVNFYS